MATSGVRNWNTSSAPPLALKVREALLDHSNRGQVLVLSEAETKRLYPNVVVASRGALKKEKADWEVLAQVQRHYTSGTKNAHL